MARAKTTTSRMAIPIAVHVHNRPKCSATHHDSSCGSLGPMLLCTVIPRTSQCACMHVTPETKRRASRGKRRR